jgi:hypothetical protein
MKLSEYIRINTHLFERSWRCNPTVREAYKNNIISYIATIIDKVSRNLHLEDINQEELQEWARNLYKNINSYGK